MKTNTDILWFLKSRYFFNFDGKDNYYNKDGKTIINYNKNGKDGITSFMKYDSNGIITYTKHPLILKTLLKVKGSINLHIKMYAEDRANGLLSKNELISICNDINAPEWFLNAVENQKWKYYDKF